MAVVVVRSDAAVRRAASLKEIHQRKVDPLPGQSVDHPRTAGRADFLAAVAGDLNRQPADEASRRAGRRRVTRHSAPVTATPRDRRRRRWVGAASAVH